MFSEQYVPKAVYMCSQSFPKEKGCEGHCDAKDLTLRANHTCFRPLNTWEISRCYAVALDISKKYGMELGIHIANKLTSKGSDQ